MICRETKNVKTRPALLKENKELTLQIITFSTWLSGKQKFIKEEIGTGGKNKVLVFTESKAKLFIVVAGDWHDPYENIAVSDSVRKTGGKIDGN